jgi:hypothetical protein
MFDKSRKIVRWYRNGFFTISLGKKKKISFAVLPNIHFYNYLNIVSLNKLQKVLRLRV